MSLRNNAEVAADIADGIRQLAKFGFRLVREPGVVLNSPEAQRDALLAASALLGIDSTPGSVQPVPVSTLAHALEANSSASGAPSKHEIFIAKARAQSELIEYRGTPMVLVPYWFMRD